MCISGDFYSTRGIVVAFYFPTPLVVLKHTPINAYALAFMSLDGSENHIVFVMEFQRVKLTKK
jgi:hypothetical protein